MSDFEILSLMLMFVGIVVGILIEYIKKVTVSRAPGAGYF